MFSILVVEDHELLRAKLADAMRSRFLLFAVAEAKCVVEPLAMLVAVCPDAAFLDINLPDGNGFEIPRRLCAKGSDASIAILTRHNSSEYVIKAMKSGANHLLVKGSASLEDIHDVVELACSSRSENRVLSADVHP